MYQIQYFDKHLEQWLPATTDTYRDVELADLDKRILAENFQSTEKFRITDITSDDGD